MRLFRERLMRGALIGLLALGLLIALWGLPPAPAPEGQETPAVQPTRKPGPVMLTRAPAGGPAEPVEPLSLMRSGSVPTPSAPMALSGASAVVNVWCVGDCTYPGSASWVTSDTLVGWTHSDPLSVDYYEVWRSRMEPYFEPATCARCELVGSTTGLEFVVPDAPPGFNPVGATQGAKTQSDLDFFRVRAVNAGGTSSVSNEIGAVTFSLLQGINEPIQ